MYKLLCDVSNAALSADHGPNIPRGTVLDLPEEAAERLTRIGAAVKVNFVNEGIDAKDLIDDLSDDLEKLKDFADQLGIQYAANIGAATLKERIEKHLEAGE